MDALRKTNAGKTAEMRLYEALGIRLFRKALFLGERLRHLRDGDKNRNYHLESLSPGAAAAFEGYLLWHTLLHAFAILLLILPFCLLRCINPGLFWPDLILLLLLIVNLYCIMLQRYTYIRLKQVCERQKALMEKRAICAARKISAVHEELLCPEDLDYAAQLLSEIHKGGVIFVDAGRKESLLRLAALFPREEAAGDDDRLHEFLPWGNRARFVSRLQRRFTPERPDLLQRCSIVTADGETDRAFRRLFCDPAPEMILQRLLILKAVKKL